MVRTPKCAPRRWTCFRSWGSESVAQITGAEPAIHLQGTSRQGNALTSLWTGCPGRRSSPATLHITEEFAFPGAFPSWYRQYRGNSSRITTRFLVLINAGLLITLLKVALVARRPEGAFLWLVFAAILASNGCWHGWASWHSRQYSPGMITGLLLYIPLAIDGYYNFLRFHAVPLPAAAIAGLIGCLDPLWSFVYHRQKRSIP